MNLFYSVYRAIGWPLASLAFHLAGPFVSKIGKGVELRKSIGGKKPWAKGPSRDGAIWIHCASGEFEYAKPVITRLKKERPDAFILITYFSPSYIGQIAKFNGVDAYCPLPWDTPSAINEFLDYHRPSVLLIARTDVWPEMARQAKKRGLPSLLFSATLTLNSGRARGLGRWMSRATFSQLNEIFAVSEEDFEVFRGLSIEPTQVTLAGDTRYDQVLARLAEPKPVRDELFTPGLPIVVCGSTWPEDEAVLIEVITKMKDRVRFVLVPHEPSDSHLSEIEAKLSASGSSSSRYTKTAEWSENVLIVDSVGILAELYLKADFAFVGGSFKKNIHSVMEPLAAGCLTLVGPYHSNNREALALKEAKVRDDLTAVAPVENAGDLILRLERALTLPKTELKLRIREEILARTGASLKVVQWFLKTESSRNR